jgi:hypothetical protein
MRFKLELHFELMKFLSELMECELMEFLSELMEFLSELMQFYQLKTSATDY